MEKMEERLIHESGIRRLDFEKFFTALKVFAAPFELGKQMRITIDYNPQKPMVKIKYFSQSE